MVRKTIVHTPFGKKTLIGEEDRGKVYYYTEGKLKGLVGRVPKDVEHFMPRPSLKNMALRFRAHQIAYLLFPEWNLRPKRFIPETKEIITQHVLRSKQNIRMATSRRETARQKKVNYPPEAVAPLKKMRLAGIDIQTGKQNVSVVNGKPTFFAVGGINPKMLRKYIAQTQITPTRKTAVLKAIELYNQLDRMSDLDVDEHYLGIQD
ncbi:MAG: hypothetical protein WCW13_01110 [archaeon]|jgi:hypothetical protein